MARKQEHKQMKQYSNNFNKDCANGLHPKNLQKRKKKTKNSAALHIEVLVSLKKNKIKDSGSGLAG